MGGRREKESYDCCRCCSSDKLGFGGLFAILSLLQREDEDAAALVTEHEKHNNIKQQWLR